MKKIALATLAVLVILATVVPDAWAGGKVRYRWEGAAIAVGSLILLDHILDSRPAHAAPVYVQPAPVYAAPAPVYVQEHRHYHYDRGGEWTCDFRDHRHRDRHRHHHGHHYDH